MATNMPEVLLQPGERSHGFIVNRTTVLPELGMIAYELVHERSGAQLLHLHTDDRENLFAIAFATPPEDNTGLPHILEHTVLCGSKKYPVKDPFVELLRTSLATFLNAMTYPDRTVYPCASMNEKDFFNIADVYCDAVFNPLLTRIHFMQEGHHLAFSDPNDPDSTLIIRGVVYNEMKGAYSDLDTLIQRRIRQALSPDNAYGLDSGGDPEELPSLTYERFKAFYNTYYHPSNSRIFVYGNIPTVKHLDFLDRNYLSAYDRTRIDISIQQQPRWTEPRREVVRYPIGSSEPLTRKTAVVMGFFVNEVTDSLRSLTMHLLDYYLLDNAASPLRKALIDSRLGEELTDSGYVSDQRDAYFTAGLKGTEPVHTDTIVDLALQTCLDVARKGLERKKVEAAFHRLELSFREIRPLYPLHLMHRVYRGWLYGVDPLHYVRINEHLAALRTHYEDDPLFLAQALEEMIVHNSHYAVLTFVPDKDYLSKKEEAFRKQMEARKAALTPMERERLAQEAREILAAQNTPNSAEAIATLPRLSLGDVSQEPTELPTLRRTVGGRPVLWTDMFTNGISYLSLAFDLKGIDEDLVDYLPLCAEALRKMGAAGLSYEQMAEREAIAIGGMEAHITCGGTVEDCMSLNPYLIVSAHARNSKFPEMLDIVYDRLLHLDLGDRQRLRDIVYQGRMHRLSDLVSRGNYYAALYAGRKLTANGAFAERVGGISQVRTYNRCAERFDQEYDDIVEKLQRICTLLRAKERITASCVIEHAGWPCLEQWFDKLVTECCEDTSGSPSPPTMIAAGPPTREGIALPTDVSFIATVFPTVPARHEAAPVLLLLSVYLSFGYLWEQIRVKRGAYGARAEYNWASGTFSLTTYRDPCIRDTLETFDRVLDHVVYEMDLSEQAIEQAIIGTIKLLDPPIRPAQAVGVALQRFLRHETPAFRTHFRKRLMSLRGEDVREVVERLLTASYKKACVCVMAHRERLEAAHALMGEKGLSITDAVY